MSYIKPDNLEVIQNFLQDAGPRGQISPEDTSNFAAPINVSFAEGGLSEGEGYLDLGPVVENNQIPVTYQPTLIIDPDPKDVSLMVETLDELTCGEWSKRFPPLDKVLVVTDEGIAREAIAAIRDRHMERDVALISPSTALSGLHQHMLERLTQDSVLPLFDAEKIQALTDTAREFGGIVDKDVVMSVPSGAHVKFTKPDLALAEMRKPGWFRKQPVRILGEVEGGGMEGRKLAQARAFETILNHLVDLPKSDPTGRNRLSIYERIPKCPCRARLSSWRIRGLLRSKTKKGPKRKFNNR